MQKDNTEYLHEHWSATLNKWSNEHLSNPSYNPNTLKRIFYKYPKHVSSEYTKMFKRLTRYPPTQFYNLEKVDHHDYLKSRKMHLSSTNQNDFKDPSPIKEHVEQTKIKVNVLKYPTQNSTYQKDFVNWGPASYKPVKRDYDVVYSLKFRPSTTYSSTYIKHELHSKSQTFHRNSFSKFVLPTGQSESRDAFTNKSIDKIERRLSSCKPVEEARTTFSYPGQFTTTTQLDYKHHSAQRRSVQAVPQRITYDPSKNNLC